MEPEPSEPSKRRKVDRDKVQLIERRVDVYRRSSLGRSLVSALQELSAENKIPESLLDVVMGQFDRSMARNLKHSQNHLVFTGQRVDSYRVIADNWRIKLKDVIFSSPVAEVERVESCTIYAAVPDEIFL